MDGTHVSRICIYPLKLIHLVSKHKKLKTPKNDNFFKEKYLKPFFEDFELIDESYDLPNTCT
jgi:hypothetical protein